MTGAPAARARVSRRRIADSHCLAALRIALPSLNEKSVIRSIARTATLSGRSRLRFRPTFIKPRGTGLESSILPPGLSLRGAGVQTPFFESVHAPYGLGRSGSDRGQAEHLK